MRKTSVMKKYHLARSLSAAGSKIIITQSSAALLFCSRKNSTVCCSS